MQQRPVASEHTSGEIQSRLGLRPETPEAFAARLGKVPHARVFRVGAHAGGPPVTWNRSITCSARMPKLTLDKDDVILLDVRHANHHAVKAIAVSAKAAGTTVILLKDAMDALPAAGRVRPGRDRHRRDRGARDRAAAGISTAFFRFYFDAKEPRAEATVVRTSFWFTMAMATLGLVLGLVFARPISHLARSRPRPAARPRRRGRPLGADELPAADGALPRRGALDAVRDRERRERADHGRGDGAVRRRLPLGRSRPHRRQLHRHARASTSSCSPTAPSSSGWSSTARCSGGCSSSACRSSRRRSRCGRSTSSTASSSSGTRARPRTASTRRP